MKMEIEIDKTIASNENNEHNDHDESENEPNDHNNEPNDNHLFDPGF